VVGLEAGSTQKAKAAFRTFVLKLLEVDAPVVLLVATHGAERFIAENAQYVLPGCNSTQML